MSCDTSARLGETPAGEGRLEQGRSGMDERPAQAGRADQRGRSGQRIRPGGKVEAKLQEVKDKRHPQAHERESADEQARLRT